MTRKKSTTKNTHLTEEEFSLIKQMKSLGISDTQAAKLANRGQATIYYVAKSRTFADYRETIHMMATRAKAAKQVNDARIAELTPKAEPVEQNMNVDQPDPMASTPTVSMYESLERIAIAVERLADAWEAAPEKKRRLF